MPDRHLCVDLETLDVDISAAIVSIGAVAFDPRGNGLDEAEYYQITIDQRSNEFHGRSVSQNTLDWWAMQSTEAKARTFNGPHTELSTALRDFTRWINELVPTCTRVWAKDPDFDVKILQHACNTLGLIWPFKFWESRSCRTAIELAYPEGDFPAMAVDGPKHDALADAKIQALEVQHVYHKLGS